MQQRGIRTLAVAEAEAVAKSMSATAELIKAWEVVAAAMIATAAAAVVATATMEAISYRIRGLQMRHWGNGD